MREENQSVFRTLGASNHFLGERQSEDYYATDPLAGELLLEILPELNNIWECACGEGHLAKVFNSAGKLAKATDLIDRGYGDVENFLLCSESYRNGDIVTNPPYIYAQQFVEHALCLVDTGRYVCMFLKVLFLEGKARKKLFSQYPPKTVYISSSRINCAKNGDFKSYTSSAIAYAWFVWLKGFQGKTVIEWIN